MTQKVGVIVGRFQVDNLHEAHLKLLHKVRQENDLVLVFIGCSPVKTTRNNPLDFQARKDMIEAHGPNIIALFIGDCTSDVEWSNKLDDTINYVVGPNSEVTLYGGRDSFLKYYYGNFPHDYLEECEDISGTEVRKQIGNYPIFSTNFRRGVIWATQNQYPKCYQTVDIAICNESYTHLFLGKKRGEIKYRFIGGFVDPGQTLEESAIREVKEETNLDVSGLEYVSSFVVEDWRYKSEPDSITTAFFVTNKRSGRPVASDDINEVEWVVFQKSLVSQVVESHKPLFKALYNKIKGEDDGF